MPSTDCFNTPGASVIAIDIPTGLDGATGETDQDCIISDFTITVGCAKSGLVVDNALDFVGRLEVVPIAALQPNAGKSLRR